MPSSRVRTGGKRILFQSDRVDGLPHIFSMEPDGSHVQQLTSGTGVDQPAASHDGKRIVFAGAPGDFSAHGIWLAGKRGGSSYGDDFRQLTFPPPLIFDPAGGFPIGGLDDDQTFSPDDKRVAFLRILDSSPTVGQTAVFTVRVDGTDLRQLTPYSGSRSPSSPTTTRTGASARARITSGRGT